MRAPWANIILLALLLIQVISGYFGFINGRDSRAWLLWLHAAGAYALVVLLYWKSEIILDALRRKRRWSRRRILFIATTGLLLVVLLTGLLWTFYGPIYAGGFSLVSLHMFLAVPLVALVLWHSWHMRFILRVPGALGRRLFLGGLVPAVGGLFLWQLAGRGQKALALSGGRRRFTGSFERGSYTPHFPTVSWIADNPPPVAAAAWRLAVAGAVARPLTIGYEELRQMADREVAATLDCTGGWYASQHWRGVNVARLLEAAGVNSEAASVTFESITGYRRRFSLANAAGFLLALDVAGQPLSHGHGFPLRLVAPGQRGVNWVKWLVAVRVNVTGPLWQLPLPLR